MTFCTIERQDGLVVAHLDEAVRVGPVDDHELDVDRCLVSHEILVVLGDDAIERTHGDGTRRAEAVDALGALALLLEAQLVTGDEDLEIRRGRVSWA